MSTVRLENVTKIFPPNVVAVNNANFKVEKGEFFVLLGPSGCGKTTTLRMIAGLERPTYGKIYINEQDVTDLPPRLRDVAMVFQTWALYPHMKVYDNIAFPLRLRKVPRSEIDRKVREVAKLLRIDDLLDRYPKQLSGGQQQRVALARALVRSPRVWLMDEPLSNLDALLRVQMRAELKRLQKELKITTIYVTHDQVEAMSMADRIAVMNKGRILQIAPPKEIYEKPRTKFVGGFVGTPPMNFIPVTFVVENDKYLLKGEGFSIELPKELGEYLREKVGDRAELDLGVRPEHIRISTSEEPNAIPATVYIVEPLGTETIVNVKVGETLVKIKVIGEALFEPSTRVWLVFDINKIHLFDTKTEEAVI
ncbi:MAG: ABC transporter ATP-binding protein [Crenarchaeota archaeon]|nr:ABC transporter ATP-binding protein [Thermoproteota archaeon]